MLYGYNLPTKPRLLQYKKQENLVPAVQLTFHYFTVNCLFCHPGKWTILTRHGQTRRS